MIHILIFVLLYAAVKYIDKNFVTLICLGVGIINQLFLICWLFDSVL